MKRSFSLWWCALLLAGPALSGCPEKTQTQDAGVVDAGPAQLNEKEPNDRAAQAQTITGSTFVVGALSADPKKPDADWYLLAPPSAQQVDVAVSAIQGADVVLGFYDVDENPLGEVNSEGEGKGERFPNLNVTNKVLLKVSGAKKGSGGAYTMTLMFSSPQDGRELEPNDRAVDATPLPLDVQVQGFLAHAGDEDWYRIELPGPAEESSAPDSGTQGAAPAPGAPAPAEGQGADAMGTAPSPNAAPEAPPAPNAAPEAPPPPGSDVAATAPAPGGAQPAPEARAQLAAAPDADAGEVPAAPTSPQPQPQPVAEAEPAIPQPELPSSALHIEVSPVKGAKLQVALMSAAEAPLFEIKGKDDEGLSLRNVGVRASDRVVYLVVKSAWSGTGKNATRGYNAEAPYTVSASIEPAGANAEYEPNDDLAHATLLPRDGYREGFLSPKTDQDFFVLRPEVPVLARFEVSGVNRLDLAMEVVQPKEGGGVETLLRANDGELKEPEILNNVLCASECYVMIESAARKVDGKWVRDFENAEEPYRLSVSMVPDTGAEEREPNNDAKRATPVAMAAPIRGTIQPRKDVDYYRLDLSARPVRTPIKATLLGILKVDLGLYLHRVNPDGSLTLVQTSDRAKGEQPEVIRYSAEPGVYVFEVKDATWRKESNFQDRYQLTVQEGD